MESMSARQVDLPGSTSAAQFAEITQAIVDLQPKKTAQLVRQALDQGLAPQEILLQGLARGMNRVGELFSAKEFFVPEVLMASKAMEAGFELLRPLLKTGDQGREGRVVLGVVQGDIHDIGKNIVKVLLEAAGFEVIDLGRDVPAATFVNSVAENRPQVLGLSSLMTTTMPLMAVIISELQKQGLRDRVKVIVGGAPVNADYAHSIGADGYASDASAAVREIKKLLKTQETSLITE
jgi:5-methyltetrahydrofolate--homocysteine methyltransferase